MAFAVLGLGDAFAVTGTDGALGTFVSRGSGVVIAVEGTVPASATKALILQAERFRYVKFMCMLARVCQQFGDWCHVFLRVHGFDANVPLLQPLKR